jgi:hypothetical protein
MNETTTLPAINTDELVAIINEAPSILEKNTFSRDKAVGFGKNLVSQAESHGMTEDLDKLMSGYLDKLRVTYKTLNERRKPFTQLVDEIKKRFTTIEADVSPTGKENIFAHVQGWRNQYATAKIEEQRKREQEASKKLAIDKELVSIRQRSEEEYAAYFSELVSSAKKELIGIFESTTLKNDNEHRNAIASFPAKLDPERFHAYIPKIRIIYASVSQVEEIQMDVAQKLYSEFNLEYASQINVLKRELIDKFTSKLDELRQIEIASTEEADRLRGEAEARRKAAEERAAKEAAEAAQRAADEASARAAAANIEATMNIQAELFQETPKVKEAYEIIVKNPAAYAMIFQFWFEKEGRGWPVDKIEKMTIGRMKSFCEAYVLKNDEKISSNLIEYKEIYKAK